MGKPVAAPVATSFSEDEFGKKLDRCGTDALVKGGKFEAAAHTLRVMCCAIT